MQAENISASNYEQCLKCNICTTVCPMMEVNPHYSGPKQAGPDGERYRLKDPYFFDKTLKYCLNCKRCEIACPSGVKVGDIIQIARLRYGRQTHPLRDTILASTDLVGSLASPLASAVNSTLRLSPVKSLMHGILGVDRHKTMPAYSREKFETWFKGQKASQERFHRFVSYFHGCYVNYNYPALGKDLVKILNACGYGIHLLDRERCCGVALISNGMGTQAKRQARTNITSMTKAVAAGEPVLTTGSTCTFTMRDEYKHVLGIDNSAVRDSIQLATKWLYDKIEAGEIQLAFKPGYKRRIAYHTACHMAKLGWAIYSTSLLRMIPGIELEVPFPHCCGIAGTFGFKKENYPYSQKIGEPQFATLKEMHPDIVATDCETCKWQIEEGTGLTVMNPVSILAEALDYEATEILNKQTAMGQSPDNDRNNNQYGKEQI